MSLDERGFARWVVDLGSRAEFESWAARSVEAIEFRRELEAKLDCELGQAETGEYYGYCWVCRKHSEFSYDRKYSNANRINWREQLLCRKCGLTNRLRLSIQTLETIVPDAAKQDIYITEQVTPTADVLRRMFPRVQCSEFLGANASRGMSDWRGVRHEDLTRLSFDDAVFDVVLSFDVLEHVPDYASALSEIRRVLKPSGCCIVTVPFSLGSEHNIVRAIADRNGQIQHLLPAEYHGDPLNPQGGVLCYYHFGWELLRNLVEAGFQKSFLQLSWSTDYANIGPEQPIIIGIA